METGQVGRHGAPVVSRVESEIKLRLGFAIILIHLMGAKIVVLQTLTMQLRFVTTTHVQLVSAFITLKAIISSILTSFFRAD